MVHRWSILESGFAKFGLIQIRKFLLIILYLTKKFC